MLQDCPWVLSSPPTTAARAGMMTMGCHIRPVGSCTPALPQSSYSSLKTVARKPVGNETPCERGKPVSLIDRRSNAPHGAIRVMRFTGSYHFAAN